MSAETVNDKSGNGRGNGDTTTATNLPLSFAQVDEEATQRAMQDRTTLSYGQQRELRREDDDDDDDDIEYGNVVGKGYNGRCTTRRVALLMLLGIVLGVIAGGLMTFWAFRRSNNNSNNNNNNDDGKKEPPNNLAPTPSPTIPGGPLQFDTVGQVLDQPAFTAFQRLAQETLVYDTPLKNANENLTLFVMDDATMSSLQRTAVLDKILSPGATDWIGHARQILLNQIVAITIPANQLGTVFVVTTTEIGDFITLKRDMVSNTVIINDQSIVLQETFAVAKNGIVHRMSAPILPLGFRLTVLDRLGTTANLSVFYGYVQQSQLQDLLNHTGPQTLFCPNNAAFARVPASIVQQWQSDVGLLRAMVLRHVVKENFVAEYWQTLQRANGRQQESLALPTLGNTTISIHMNTTTAAAPTTTAGNARLFVNGGQARIGLNTIVSNGAVYTINEVLV